MRCRTAWVMACALSVLGCEQRSDETRGARPTESAVESPSAPAPSEPAGEPWWQAAAAGDVDRLRQLLASGVDVNSKGEHERAALALAAYDGHTQAVQLLLKRGADINHQDDLGRSALMYAASGPHPATVQLLLQRGADPNLVDRAEGWTALMWAAAEGQLHNVELLLEHNANRDVVDQDGDTAKSFAIKNGHPQVARLL